MAKKDEPLGELGTKTYKRCRLKVIQTIVFSFALGIFLCILGIGVIDSGFATFAGLAFVIMATANLFRIRTLAERKYNNQHGIRLNIKNR